MTTVAKIKCCNCDNFFSIYWTALPKGNYQCPHCFSTMSEYMTSQTREAIGALYLLNYYFNKYSDEKNEPRFEVNIEEVHVPFKKYHL